MQRLRQRLAIGTVEAEERMPVATAKPSTQGEKEFVLVLP
jgi:hypothetical protein